MVARNHSSLVCGPTSGAGGGSSRRGAFVLVLVFVCTFLSPFAALMLVVASFNQGGRRCALGLLQQQRDMLGGRCQFGEFVARDLGFPLFLMPALFAKLIQIGHN